MADVTEVAGGGRLSGVFVGHFGRAEGIRLDPGGESGAGYHAHDIPDEFLSLSIFAHVQMDFDVHVGIAVLRQPVGDIARQFQAFGRLIEDALPQAPACSFMLAAVVVSSATAYTVDDDCADETGVIANLRVSADYQLVVGTGHVMHVGHYVVERLI